MALFEKCVDCTFWSAASKITKCAICSEQHCQIHIVKHIEKHTEQVDHLRMAGLLKGGR